MGLSQRSFALSCLLLALSAVPAAGEHRHQAHRRPRSAFLGAVDAARLNRQLQHAIKDSLGNDLNHADMAAVKTELTPMWQSLAKDANGKIDLRSFRYALQRYMHKKYHLSIVGLELAASQHSDSAGIMSHAPELVQNILHGNSTSADGFQVDDLVATVAMLEQLLMHSGSQMLGSIYHKLHLDPNEALSREDVNQVVSSYLLRWVMTDDPEVAAELEADTQLRDSTLPIWPEMAKFAHGLVDGFEYDYATKPHAWQKKGGQSQWRPMRPSYSFADVNAMVGKLPFAYGEFWRDECDKVRDSLLKLDYQSTGRVKLSDFHGAALNGEWRFSESKEYLRKLGALDESSTHHGPRVIVPNYLHGPSNCIVSDTRYRVCCANECEDYMAEIEEGVASPTADPEQLLAVVSNIASHADDARPAITSSLKSQLTQIAQLHQGQIPVHGRLFAQWLHYVFPRDCPFPHKTGTVMKLSPTQFGEGYLAKDDEMRRHARQNQTSHNQSQHLVPDHDDWMTQWSQDEELLTGDFDLKAPWETRLSFTPRWVCVAMLGALVALGSIGFGSKAGSEKTGISFRPKEHLV